MRVVGLSGPAQSGKDTAASALVDQGWTRISFADAVREGLLGINPRVEVTPLLAAVPLGVREIIPLREAVDRFGWDQLKQLAEVRGLLQRYGTEGGRDIHGPRCWVNAIKLRMLKNRGIRFVIPDVRFPEEVQFIRDLGGCVIRIERPGYKCPMNGSTSQHRSEHSLDDSHWDAMILNSTTPEDLRSTFLGAMELTFIQMMKDVHLDGGKD